MTDEHGDELQRRFATRAVHEGRGKGGPAPAHNPPIVQTSTFVLGRASKQWDEAVDPTAGHDGNEEPAPQETRDTYSRAGNPTVRRAEQRLASLEACEAAVAFASGMGAISGLLLSLLKPGDEVLTLGPIYSDTRAVLHELLATFGITTRRVTADTLAGSLAAHSKLVYLETPSNPTLSVIDLAAVADSCRSNGLLSVADNTFASPFLTRPRELGIDLVVHSATKYLGGHGDLLAGFVAGRAELVDRVRSVGLRLVGASLEPHAAFLLLRGMSTLHLRMAAHCRNAMAVAEALHEADGVVRVHYPGLPDDPGHDVAARQMDAFGGMVAVDLGSERRAAAFVDALRLFDHAVSLGDASSLACISATTTHAGVPAAERARDGIGPGMVRLSVGIEDTGDLVADVKRAVRAANAV